MNIITGASSVLNHKFSTPNDNHSKIPEPNSIPIEQEHISRIKKSKNIEEFKLIHCQIIKSGLFYTSLCATNLFATCALSHWGSMDYACSIFKHIQNPGSFEFNTMIRGYIKDMNLNQALSSYLEMIDREIEQDKFTFPALLKGCSLQSALGEGKQIHGQIYKLGFVQDLFVQNSLINMYGKCGEIGNSCAVFDQMEEKNVASWSALIASHANLGSWGECIKLFREMNFEGFCRGEESTLVSVVSACAKLGFLDLGKSLHGFLIRNLSGLNVAVETSLIDMYVKCGSLSEGMCVFRKMGSKNRKSFSVVISGLARHGYSEEALKVFDEMVEGGLEPDDVVYVGVLSACARLGLVEKGSEFFDRMRFGHGIKPTVQHYGCMVELMGRAGRVDEAFELIDGMSEETKNDALWRSLLGSCKIHKDVELGEKVAENLFQINPRNASDYLTMSNIYAQAQEWESVSKTRTKMARDRLSQVPGSSSVEVNKTVHKFLSYDKSHPRSQEIYEMVHQMELQLKFEGYLPDTSQVLLNVDDEEKRHRLSSHSQKLAIAFSLIDTCEGSPIRIVRNVRMCSDCHAYTKLVSTIYEREIVVRDRNRFHHFKDGSCSCNDYW